jgi:hypothetical protein
MLRILIGCLSGLLVCGCSPIYTPAVAWSHSYSSSAYPTNAEIEAAAEKDKNHLWDDLRACVAEFDPDHLYEMKDGQLYKTTGWFVNVKRTDPVVNCMNKKDWSVAGPAL